MNPFETDTHGTRIAWLLILIVEVAAAALLFVAFTGCSNRVLIEEPSAVVLTPPDTTIRTGPAPLPRVRAQTMPKGLVEYRQPDTLSAAADVTAVVATPETITIRTRTGERTYRRPVKGETLVVSADTAGQLVAGVAGKQQKRTVDVPKESFLGQLATLGRCVTVVLVLVICALVVLKIRS